MSDLSETTMGEVMYRTVIILCKTHDDGYKALDMAKARGIYHGSSMGLGLSQITLLCTQGEAGQYGYDLHWQHDVQNRVIWEDQAPHRPENWQEPEYRPNWERTGKTAIRA